METYEVYAQNIQPAQLKQMLHTSLHTTKGIEDERNYFLFWLKNRWERGMRYENQLIAWEDYKLYNEFSVLDDEDEETNWMSDIETAFVEQISPRNYNEFGGQQ